jgi:uncharacterized membrane protein
VFGRGIHRVDTGARQRDGTHSLTPGGLMNRGLIGTIIGILVIIILVIVIMQLT